MIDEAPTAVLAKYSNYSNIFFKKNATKLPKNIGINEHTNKLEKNK